MAKSAVKSVFPLDPLPAISHPKPPFFVRFSRFWVENRLFRSFSFFSALDFLAQNLILRRKNQFNGVFLFGVRPKFDFCRRRKEKVGISSPNNRRNNIKMKKGGAEIGQSGSKKKRPSRKSQRTRPTSKRTTQKRPSTSKQGKLFFSPSPTPLKNTSRLSLKTSPLFATSSLDSLKTSLPHPKPLSSYAQDTRLRVYTRMRTQRICHFCLHPSPCPATNCISTG